MVINIEISDRDYRDIELYCNANGLDLKEYISNLIMETHYCNKYGDLNTMMEKVAEESTASPKKKVVRTNKSNAKVKEENGVEEQLEVNKKQITDNEAAPTEKVEKVIVKRKRTLNTL